MTTINSLHESLQVIYRTYDRIYDIASHRWHPSGYYDDQAQTSDLFGHYVRSLPRFAAHPPSHITTDQFAEYAETLVEAFNTVLPLILPDNLKSADIRSICAGTAAVFYHDSPYDRCMAAFRLVEKVYPRADHIDGAKVRKKRKPSPRKAAKSQAHSTYLKPQPVATWKPYKED